MPKSHAEELSAMRHGPELHDALRQSQSAAGKSAGAVVSATNRSSAPDVQKSAVPVMQQMPPAHAPYSDVPRTGYNGTSVGAAHTARESSTVEQQQQQQLPRTTVNMMQQHGVIADSGYWSPKNYNYNNSSDYHVPTTKPAELQRGLSTGGSRPVVPPPAPPPLGPDSQQSMSDRDRLVENTGHPALRQSTQMSTASPSRVIANRDSLPPPPPAPSTMVEPHQSVVGNYTLQNETVPVDERNAVALSAYYDLPPPPMPPLFDDMPADPLSQLLPPTAPDSYVPQDANAESPLPLPPEDVNFNSMIVPPPPPPLVETEPMLSKLDNGKIGNGAADSLDRLQLDSASLSSEASSQAARSVPEETSEAPVRDHRSDLLDAIRKGQWKALEYV